MPQSADPPVASRLRATSVLPATGREEGATLLGTVVPAHDQRRLRRRMLTLACGERVLVDLPRAIALGEGDRLVPEDGRCVGVAPAREELCAVTARDRLHLAVLAWHLGNRHVPAHMEKERILVLRDQVIRGILETLGAGVAEAFEPFSPLNGAYHGHEHAPKQL